MAGSMHVEISLRVLLAGLISGLVASLWTLLPFFIAGLSNIFFITVISGLVLLFVLAPWKRQSMLQSGVVAIITFVVVSYVIVPFGSGLVFGGDGELISGEGYETLNLKLPGLFCQGCAYSSQSALKGIPGVVDAKIDFGTKSGIVVYDPEIVSPQTIVSNNMIQAYNGYIE